MRTIWKFPVRIRHWTRLDMQPGDKPVFVGIDPATGGPAIWAEVSRVWRSPAAPNEPMDPGPFEQRAFTAIGTGDPVDPEDEYVGTVIDRDFVWHVYERRP